MPLGTDKGEPHLSQDDGGRGDGGVPRRRGRPPRRGRVAVEYRPWTGEEEKKAKEAVRQLLREMVRRRMGST